MKRRLFYLAPLLLILAIIGSSLVHPPSAAAAPSPASYCKSQGYTQGGRNGADYTACVDGYSGKLASRSLQTSCPSSLGGSAGQQGTGVAICTAAWNAAAAVGKPTPQPPQNPSQEAQQQCNNAEQGSSPAIAACEIGYDSAKAGKNLSDSCSALGSGSKTLGSSTDCETGWDLAKGITPPGAGTTGTGTGTGTGSGPTTPTCEASGFSLSWIMCPIFNLISDGAHWILQSIIQPFLVTTPVSTDPANPSYQIWSNFRIYGDIFLVLGLLVIVFGESIGGGLIEAYTVKKVLPRLLAAAILINLSIYIVAFLVDFTNILGKGVSDIMTAPLSHCTVGAGNCWAFHLSTADTARVFGVGLIGFLATSTAITGLLASIFFGGFAAAGVAITAAFFVMIPFIFAVLGVFITLIFRQGLILLLMLVSPVAFALYCLPNTERIFRRWWDLLIEALMVYPIVIAIFGAADILSITILQANSIHPSDLGSFTASNISRTLALVVAFLLQFLPLLAIPFAFRFASGTLRRAYDLTAAAGQKAHQLTQTRREQAQADYKAQSFAGRARTYQTLQSFGERHKGPLGTGQRSSRWLARRAGGYNIEALASAGRAEVAKQLNDQINTGRDEEIRGLTVNKQWALRQGQEGTDWRTNSDGAREFMTLGGAWVGEEAVDAGHRRWGNNQYAQQAALSYEMRKGITEEQSDRIAQVYSHVASSEPGGWGMGGGEAAGAFKGAAFENQNQHLEYKYVDAATGGLQDDKGFVDEIYERRGSYTMAQMNSRTIEQLKVAHQAAGERGDADQQQKIAAIAETFMHDVGVGGQQVGTAGEEGPPIIDPGTGQVIPGRRQASTQGAAHVAERVRELAALTGIADNLATGAPGVAPRGQYPSGHAPTPNRREQK